MQPLKCLIAKNYFFSSKTFQRQMQMARAPNRAHIAEFKYVYYQTRKEQHIGYKSNIRNPATWCYA